MTPRTALLLALVFLSFFSVSICSSASSPYLSLRGITHQFPTYAISVDANSGADSAACLAANGPPCRSVNYAFTSGSALLTAAGASSAEWNSTLSITLMPGAHRVLPLQMAVFNPHTRTLLSFELRCFIAGTCVVDGYQLGPIFSFDSRPLQANFSSSVVPVRFTDLLIVNCSSPLAPVIMIQGNFERSDANVESGNIGAHFHIRGVKFIGNVGLSAPVFNNVGFVYGGVGFSLGAGLPRPSGWTETHPPAAILLESVLFQSNFHIQVPCFAFFNSYVDFYQVEASNHIPVLTLAFLFHFNGFGHARLNGLNIHDNGGFSAHCNGSPVCGPSALSFGTVNVPGNSMPPIKYSDIYSALVEESTFKSNLAFFGTVIYHSATGGVSGEGDDYAIIISNCSFVSNVAIQFGCIIFSTGPGLVKFRDSSFVQNRADTGAILSTTAVGKYYFIGSSFIGNSALQGAIIAPLTDGLATESYFLLNCYFANNVVEANGAIVFLQLSQGKFANIRMDNNVFYRNQASRGSVLYAVGSAVTAYSVVSTNNTFLENQASAAGGAVWISMAKYQSTSNRYIRNSSPLGGSNYISAATTQIIHNNDYFEENTALYQNGGAIFIEFGSAGVIDNTVFIRNRASNGQGGAIHDSSNFQYRNTSFIQNSALSGAALYYPIHYTSAVIPASRCPAMFQNVSFVGNQATHSGAAMMFDGLQPICANPCAATAATFSDTNVLSFSTSKCTFMNNSAGSGWGANWALNPHSAVVGEFRARSLGSMNTEAAYTLAKASFDSQFQVPGTGYASVSLYPGLDFDLSVVVLDILNRTITLSSGGTRGCLVTLGFSVNSVSATVPTVYSVSGFTTSSLIKGFALFRNLKLNAWPGAHVELTIDTDPISQTIRVPVRVLECPAGFISSISSTSIYSCIPRPIYLNGERVTWSISSEKAALAYFVGCVGIFTTLILMEQIVSARAQRRSYLGWLAAVILSFSFSTVWSFMVIAVDSINIDNLDWELSSGYLFGGLGVCIFCSFLGFLIIVRARVFDPIERDKYRINEKMDFRQRQQQSILSRENIEYSTTAGRGNESILQDADEDSNFEQENATEDDEENTLQPIKEAGRNAKSQTNQSQAEDSAALPGTVEASADDGDKSSLDRANSNFSGFTNASAHSGTRKSQESEPASPKSAAQSATATSDQDSSAPDANHWIRMIIDSSKSLQILAGNVLIFTGTAVNIFFGLQSFTHPNIQIHYNPSYYILSVIVSFIIFYIAMSLLFFYYRHYRSFITLIAVAALTCLFYITQASLTIEYYNTTVSIPSTIPRSNLTSIIFACSLLSSFLLLIVNVYSLRLSRSHLTLALQSMGEKLIEARNQYKASNQQIAQLKATLELLNYLRPILSSSPVNSSAAFTAAAANDPAALLQQHQSMRLHELITSLIMGKSINQGQLVHNESMMNILMMHSSSSTSSGADNNPAQGYYHESTGQRLLSGFQMIPPGKLAAPPSISPFHSYPAVTLNDIFHHAVSIEIFKDFASIHYSLESVHAWIVMKKFRLFYSNPPKFAGLTAVASQITGNRSKSGSSSAAGPGQARPSIPVPSIGSGFAYSLYQMEMAKWIYYQFFSPHASQQINVSESMLKSIRQAIFDKQSISQSLFDPAIKECQQLIQTNTWGLFTGSMHDSVCRMLIFLDNSSRKKK